MIVPRVVKSMLSTVPAIGPSNFNAIGFTNEGSIYNDHALAHLYLDLMPLLQEPVPKS